MASKFDKQLEKILKGDISSLIDDLQDTDDNEEEHINEPEELLPVVYEKKETALALGNKDIQEDYELARSNLHGILGKSNAALELALKIGVLSENPRALEVAATLIRISGDLSKDLITLHKTIESAKGKGKGIEGGQYTQINNNYYGDKEQATKIIDALPDDDDGEE